MSLPRLLLRAMLVVFALHGCDCTGSAPPIDAGTPDAGRDAGPADAGPPDAGPPDAGPPDAGPPDAGPPDAGPPDAGPPDAGPPDAGPTDAGRPDAGPDAGTFGLAARPPNPTCVAPARPVIASGVQLVRAWPALTFSQPLELLQAPGDASRIVVGERQGLVRAFPNVAAPTAAQLTTVLNITTRVNSAGEGGLLGLALPPDWATNKVLYASFTETNGGGLRSVVSRFRSLDNGVTFSAASEEVLLRLDQPFTNHNGGDLHFGPDGFLYVGFGDGGSGGDPLNSGQRLNTLLGKMLRLDVSVPAAQRYAIPPGNPFATQPDGGAGVPCNLNSSNASAPDVSTRCAEIYAWGFRNPWRWSFDPGTGDLWVGDVGQGAWEEVDRVVLGGNYGWRLREGKHCYATTPCPTAGLIDPVVDYDRSQGQSITGGYTYRGSTIPGLVGRFVYADYQTGRLWALRDDPGTGQTTGELLQATGRNLASFGQTLDGEVYALDISGGGAWKLSPMGTPPVDTFPQRLSQTGCFNPADPRQPLPALIPYELNSPLWSDGAAKERFFAIPDGTTISVAADGGDFELPTGSVTAKTFWLGGQRVETRLFVRHSDGQWAGYSYEWSDDQSDAVLLPAAKTKAVGTGSWTYPSRAQCLSCHTSAAGRTLGLEAAQLNRAFTYPSTGLTRNQLATLEGVGFFSAPLGAASSLFLEPPQGSGPLEARARSYLHSNCSGCHRDGAGQGPQDLRFSLPLSQANLCNVAPTNGDQGLTNPRLLVPGEPARSLVSYRMKTPGAPRMPPLGTVLIDDAGVGLIDAWVAQLAACP